MKEGIGLLAAILGLTTAVIVLLAALNKTDTVEVPVIREIQVLQPSTSTQPTTTTETEPITETVLVPDLRGFTEADAGIALDDEGLGAEIGEAAGTELCVGLSSGQVASTDPPAGMPLAEGDTTVTLNLCE